MKKILFLVSLVVFVANRCFANTYDASDIFYIKTHASSTTALESALSDKQVEKTKKAAKEMDFAAPLIAEGVPSTLPTPSVTPGTFPKNGFMQEVYWKCDLPKGVTDPSQATSIEAVTVEVPGQEGWVLGYADDPFRIQSFFGDATNSLSTLSVDSLSLTSVGGTTPTSTFSMEFLRAYFPFFRFDLETNLSGASSGGVTDVQTASDVSKVITAGGNLTAGVQFPLLAFGANSGSTNLRLSFYPKFSGNIPSLTQFSYTDSDWSIQLKDNLFSVGKGPSSNFDLLTRFGVIRTTPNFSSTPDLSNTNFILWTYEIGFQFSDELGVKFNGVIAGPSELTSLVGFSVDISPDTGSNTTTASVSPATPSPGTN